MYCRNCGKEIADGAPVCMGCGLPVGKGNSYCHICGNEVHPEAVICVNCGASLVNEASKTGTEQKSKLAAGLLGIFLGVFGIHNFYLGFTSRAVGQLLLGTLGSIVCGAGPLVSGIWGFVEGILYLTGSKDTDAAGNKLGE